MASYDTIPTPAVEDGPKPKTSLKRILAAAALTSFALGALAATAVTMPAGVTQTALNAAVCEGHADCARMLHNAQTGRSIVIRKGPGYSR